MKQSSKANSFLPFLPFLLLFLAVITSTIFSLYGFKLRSQFHNGDECEMTYSRYQFVDLKFTHNGTYFDSRYKLFKFTDRLDQRYSHLRQNVNNKEVRKDNSENWCQVFGSDAKVGYPVIYVPGHWGEYHQSRSLGAHGIRLSAKFDSRRNEIVESLANGTFFANADTIDNFIYDVYAIDFGGEGSGLHASRLVAQADFIAKSVEMIIKGCGSNIDDITIVAHSIGGLAARMGAMTLLRNQLNGEYATRRFNIITLATPHVGLPFSFDDSIINFYKNIRYEEKSLRDMNMTNDYNIISISGGHRDELIPAEWCSVLGREENAGMSVSILASDVMPKNVGHEDTLMYGMDHKAIVWCHNILSVVRELIYLMKVSSRSTVSESRFQTQEYISEKIRSAAMTCPNNDLNDGRCQSSYSYKHQVQAEQESLTDLFGEVGVLALLSTMLYNIHLFALFYVLNSIVHNIFLLLSTKESYYSETVKCYFICPLVSIAIKSFFYQLDTIASQTRIKVVVLIAYMAMNLYYAILYGLIPLSSYIVNSFVSRLFKFSKRPESSQNTRPLLREMYRFITSAVTYALFLKSLVITGVIDSDDFTANELSLASHTFLAMVLLIVFDIICIGLQMTKSMEDLKQNRMIAAFLFPLFLMVVTGKVIYASSLLTKWGQYKAAPFIELERIEWVNHYGNWNLMELIWKYDLARFSVSTCLPIYLMLLCTRYKV